MSKTTKTQAKECYDSFFGCLRCYNGGTREENERSAAHCLARLEEEAAKAKALAANPSKLLRQDAWLWEALTVTIPARVESFRKRYFSTEPASNVIQFPHPKFYQQAK